jgi:hypothetical protein
MPALHNHEYLESQLEHERSRRQEAERKVAQIQQLLQEERLQRQRLEMELYVRRKGLLSLWDIRDYVRLLWWIVVSPAELKEYRAYADGRIEDDLRRQGSWLASSLTWLMILAWAALPWVSGLVPLPPSSGWLLLAAIVFAWVANGILGAHDNPLSALGAVFVTAATTLITMAITSGLVFRFADTTLILGGGVLAVMAALVAHALSAVLTLQVAEVSASVAAVVIGAGVAVLLSQNGQHLLYVSVIVLGGIGLVAITQERYRDA